MSASDPAFFRSGSIPPSGTLPRLGVFLSGSGRTLLNLVDHIRRGRLRASIPLVVASKECLGAQRARELGIHTEVIPGDIDADRLLALCRDHAIDWVVLAGYLRLLPVPPPLVGRMVNIHPALLPNFGGPGMYGHRVHQAVLAAKCPVSGCTVHLCDPHYDRGPIILQKTCPVFPDDTPDTLAARVFELECETYPEALELLFSNGVKGSGGTSPRTPTA
jgi:folate-dependent phosphoribosylglycinamide formyltransferase PurN